MKRILFILGITDPRTIDKMPFQDIVKRYSYRFLSTFIVSMIPILCLLLYSFFKFIF